MIVRSLDIDGLKVKYSSLTLFRVKDATAAALTNEVNPLFIPSSVTVKNTYLITDGGEQAFKPKPSYFDDVFATIKIDY